MTATGIQPFAGLALRILLLLPILAAACGPIRLEGEGPIEITPEVQEGYAEFQNASEPMFFAVSLDGAAYGYTTCSSTAPCRPAGARDGALQACLLASNGEPCRIYADRRGIVWKDQ